MSMGRAGKVNSIFEAAGAPASPIKVFGFGRTYPLQAKRFEALEGYSASFLSQGQIGILNACGSTSIIGWANRSLFAILDRLTPPKIKQSGCQNFLLICSYKTTEPLYPLKILPCEKRSWNLKPPEWRAGVGTKSVSKNSATCFKRVKQSSYDIISFS